MIDKINSCGTNSFYNLAQVKRPADDPLPEPKPGDKILAGDVLNQNHGEIKMIQNLFQVERGKIDILV